MDSSKIHPQALLSFQVRLIALTLIGIFEEYFVLLSDVKKSNSLFPQNNPPEIKSWLRLYYSHRKISSICVTYLQEIVQANLPPLPDIAKCVISNNLNPLSFLFSSDSEALICTDKARECLFRPELFFFFRVIAPCLFFYQDLPSSLYRQARLGKVSALDKILRIDKAVICDSRIANHFYKAAASNKKRSFQQLVNALKGVPQQKISPRKVNYTVAALISLISEEFGTKLSSTEIRKLFEQHQTLANPNQHLDPDLPFSDEAFSKAIRRERSIWEKLA